MSEVKASVRVGSSEMARWNDCCGCRAKARVSGLIWVSVRVT
jgi:hypothetical protein